jgi:helix-turn-helix protein
MGYFLITKSQSWRCPVSWYLQNQVCENADTGFYRSDTEFAVMRALVSFANDDGRNCYPSFEKLLKRIRCKRATLCKVLKEFASRRWIRVKHTGRSNVYEILPHGCVEPQKSNSQTSEIQNLDFRSPKFRHNSYQVLPSKNSNQSITEEGQRIERIFLEGNGKEEAVARGQAPIPSSVTPSDSVAQPPRALEKALLTRGCLDSDVWRSIVDGVKARRPLMASWIECATPVQREGTSLTLGFGPSVKSAFESLVRPSNQRFMEELLGSLFGGTWKLTLELREDLPEPPELVEQRSQVAAARQNEQKRRVIELQDICVDDNNAHTIWERLLHQPDPVLEQIGKEHNDRRAAGMARKILQRRKAANRLRMAHP